MTAPRVRGFVRGCAICGLEAPAGQADSVELRVTIGSAPPQPFAVHLMCLADRFHLAARVALLGFPPDAPAT